MNRIEIMWSHLYDPADRGTAVLPLPVAIGSAPNNHLVLADPEAGVSRTHALLTYRQDGIQLRDLNSTNGIYVDGQQINTTRLVPNSQFSLGSYELRINPLIRCTNPSCKRLVIKQATSCPWCGYFLADAKTQTYFGMA